MGFSLRIAAHSEIGLVRNNNQDSAYVSPSMIVVADGMGGAAAGDLASAVAVRELQRTDEQNLGDPADRIVGDQMLEALGGALTKANDTLADLVVWDHSLEGMGTTVCGAMFSGTQFGIAHIGDSRGYLLRDGEFRRLTHDHSWVQSLVDEGRISLAEAADHPHRSLLLKVLNGQPNHTPDFDILDAREGDRLLFCSDGLCGMVDDDQIEKLLIGEDLDAIVENLTKAAHEGGGLDNITLAVADVVPPNAELDAAAPRVLGAAATVTIPKVDSLASIDLGDREDTHRINLDQIPTAPAPAARRSGIPAGVIDPDRFEEIRYRPQLTSRRRRLVPLFTSIIAVVAILVAGLFGGQAYLSTQYYLDVQPSPEGDRVAIFQGIPETVLGQPLHELVEVTPVLVDYLPDYYRNKVIDHEYRFDSQSAALDEVNRILKPRSERCQAEAAAAAQQPSPSPEVPPDPAPDEPGATETAAPDAPPVTEDPPDTGAPAEPGPGPASDPGAPATTSAVPTKSAGSPTSTPSTSGDLEVCPS